MRSFFSILLLIALILPIPGTVIYLKITKRQIRREVKHKIIEGISKEELVLLKFSKSDLKQLKWKHSKEFEYDGSMYDIVDSIQSSDSISYWCWWDNKETKLNKQLDHSLALIFGKDKRTQRSQDHLSHFIQTLYHSVSSIAYDPKAISIVGIHEENIDLIKHYYSPPTPPPQV